jgi:hypothetical protein
MRILQLCCFSNLWPTDYDVVNIDLSTGLNVLDLPFDYGKDFDFIISAPPCTQFTKANSSHWVENPLMDIAIVQHCLAISLLSGKPFILENPPGRLDKLLPVITKYRKICLSDIASNKEWVLYSNMKLIRPSNARYGKAIVSSKSKRDKLIYPQYFIDYCNQQLLLHLNPGVAPGQMQSHVDSMHKMLLELAYK